MKQSILLPFIFTMCISPLVFAEDASLRGLLVGRCEAGLDPAHQMAAKILRDMSPFVSSFRVESLEFQRDSSRDIISVYTLTNGGMTRRALDLDLEGIRKLSMSIKDAKDKAMEAIGELSLERQFRRMTEGESTRDQIRARWNRIRGAEGEKAPMMEIHAQLVTLGEAIKRINEDLSKSYTLIDSSMRILTETMSDVDRQIAKIDQGLRIYNIIFLQVGRMILREVPDLNIDRKKLRDLRPKDGVNYILEVLQSYEDSPWSKQRIGRLKEIIEWYQRGYSSTLNLKAGHLDFRQFLVDYYGIYRAYKAHQAEISGHFFNLSFDLILDATRKITGLMTIQARLTELEDRQNRLSGQHARLARQAAETEISEKREDLKRAMANIVAQSNTLSQEAYSANRDTLSTLEDRSRFEEMIQAIRASEETLHRELSRSIN